MRRALFSVAAIAALTPPVEALSAAKVNTVASFGCSSVIDLKTAFQMHSSGRSDAEALAMTDCIVVPAGSSIDIVSRLDAFKVIAIVGIDGKDYRLIVDTRMARVTGEWPPGKTQVIEPAAKSVTAPMHKPDIPGSEMYVICVVGLSATISEHHRGKEVEPAINQAFDYCQQYAPDVSDADLTELAKYIYTFLDPMLDLS